VSKKDVLKWKYTSFLLLFLIFIMTLFWNPWININQRSEETDDIQIKPADYEKVEDFAFDKMEARVIPKSSYVLSGDYYEADISLIAFNSVKDIRIIIGEDVDKNTLEVFGDTTVIHGINGFGKLKIPASETGVHKIGGIIEVNADNGEVYGFPFENKYYVGAPRAIVSASKMNVFYLGIDNPVTISIPGIPDEKIFATISRGSLISKGNGEYTARLERAGTVRINVFTEFEGDTIPMGVGEFRGKSLPVPVPYLANKRGGDFRRGQLLAQPYVTAVMENFDIDIRFEIVSYTFLYKNNAGEIISIKQEGFSFNQEMKDIIESSHSGDRFWIEDIIASGPGGTKDIGSIHIRITQ